MRYLPFKGPHEILMIYCLIDNEEVILVVSVNFSRIKYHLMFLSNIPSPLSCADKVEIPFEVKYVNREIMGNPILGLGTTLGSDEPRSCDARKS